MDRLYCASLNQPLGDYIRYSIAIFKVKNTLQFQ